MHWKMMLLRNKAGRFLRMRVFVLRLWLLGVMNSFHYIRSKKPISMLRIKVIRVNGNKVKSR